MCANSRKSRSPGIPDSSYRQAFCAQPLIIARIAGEYSPMISSFVSTAHTALFDAAKTRPVTLNISAPETR